MTVRENLLMGAYPRSDRKAVAADLEWMPTLFPPVAERINQRAGVFSGGEQQMLAMARALMGRPRLICMDEPTRGLSPLYVDRMLELIAEINREGITVFMVEQNANRALQIGHEGYVLQTGRIVLHGSAADSRDDPRIRAPYLAAWRLLRSVLGRGGIGYAVARKAAAGARISSARLPTGKFTGAPSCFR
jgi:branched-chain amino acid transport system ATP-binding protein